MRWLTGCAQFRYTFAELNDMDGLWTRLEDACERNFPICCCTYSKQELRSEPVVGTPGQEEPDMVAVDHEKHGLDDNSAYTVI